MSEHENRQVVREAFDSWNAKNIERYVGLLDDDCVWQTHGTLAHRGRNASRETMQAYFDRIPDLTFEVKDLIASGDCVVARWRARGTPRTAPGSSLQVHGLTVAVLKNRRIASRWDYWDTDAMLRYIHGQ